MRFDFRRDFKARVFPLLILLSLCCLVTAATARATVPYITESIAFPVKGHAGFTATIKHPAHSHRARLPLLLVFGGFKEAAKTLDLLHPRTELMLASFDYPFTPPRKFVFPQSLKYAPEAKALIHDMPQAISQLVQILSSRADVDPERISIVGASFGAPFALSAAAGNPSIHGLVLIHGFGQLRTTAMHQLLRSWKPKYGSWAYVPAWMLTQFGWLYLHPDSPEDAARKLIRSQKVFMISAEQDSFIPRPASESLWQALQRSPASSERKILPGDHLQPGSDALIEKIMGEVMVWMERVGLS